MCVMCAAVQQLNLFDEVLSVEHPSAARLLRKFMLGATPSLGAKVVSTYVCMYLHMRTSVPGAGEGTVACTTVV